MDNTLLPKKNENKDNKKNLGIEQDKTIKEPITAEPHDI
jgi:hypothetical protein